MAFARVLSLEHPVLDFSKSPSLARQEFLADSDINSIVDRFLHTGVLPQPNLGRPSVDGLDCPGDFADACDMLFEQEQETANSDVVSNPDKLDDILDDKKNGDNKQQPSASAEEEANE